MWGILRIEGRLYISVYRDRESKVLTYEKFGVDGECHVLPDIIGKVGERAGGWDGGEAVSCEVGAKGTGGHGKILEAVALILMPRWKRMLITPLLATLAKRLL